MKMREGEREREIFSLSLHILTIASVGPLYNFLHSYCLLAVVTWTSKYELWGYHLKNNTVLKDTCSSENLVIPMICSCICVIFRLWNEVMSGSSVDTPLLQQI